MSDRPDQVQVDAIYRRAGAADALDAENDRLLRRCDDLARMIRQALVWLRTSDEQMAPSSSIDQVAQAYGILESALADPKASRFESERAHAHAMLDGLLEDAEDCWYDTEAWRLLDTYVFDNICGPARLVQAEHQDQCKANDQ